MAKARVSGFRPSIGIIGTGFGEGYPPTKIRRVRWFGKAARRSCMVFKFSRPGLGLDL